VNCALSYLEIVHTARTVIGVLFIIFYPYDRLNRFCCTIKVLLFNEIRENDEGTRIPEATKWGVPLN